MGKLDDLYEYDPTYTARGQDSINVCGFEIPVQRPRKKALAFCMNYRCGFNHGKDNLLFTRYGTPYLMNMGAIAYMITDKKSIDFCPHCDYALFWAVEYMHEIKKNMDGTLPRTGQQRSRKAYG